MDAAIISETPHVVSYEIRAVVMDFFVAVINRVDKQAGLKDYRDMWEMSKGKLRMNAGLEGAHTNNTCRKALFAMAMTLGLISSGICDPTQPQVSKHGLVSGIDAPLQMEFLGSYCKAGYSACDASKALVEYYLPREGPKSWTRMLALRLNV
jgi:hypothetical protein